jgi:hypothetical protein
VVAPGTSGGWFLGEPLVGFAVGAAGAMGMAVDTVV